MKMKDFKPEHFAWRVEGGVAIVSLSRPERKNPITFESYAELRDTFRKLVDADDIKAVVDAAHENHILCKVIIETALLTDDEKVRACLAAKNAGADFVKTSTGFSKGGATANDVALMRRTVGSALGVKASGGVKGIDDARAMFEAGATRIGASVGVKIAQEASGMKPTITAGTY